MPKKKRLSNKAEKKQSSLGSQAKVKLTDTIDTSKASVATAMPLSKIIDVEKIIKKDKEVKESDVFDLPRKSKAVKK
tara:strand:- start:2411 stop:2641 length:231 start_codon:yes stop_codon:yes gene_type:complete